MAQLIYSIPNRWFFVHIPKNGGSSFAETIKCKPQRILNEWSTSLLYVNTLEYHNHSTYFCTHYAELKELIPVCLVRNPWDRCLSLYLFNVINAEKNLHENWAKCVHSRLTQEGFKRSWMPNGFFRDAENMAKALCKYRVWQENDPQISWINDKTKYFRLEDELDLFYDYIKLPPPEKKLNVTHHSHYSYYYDKELKQEIDTLYQEDIVKFGYSF